MMLGRAIQSARHCSKGLLAAHTRREAPLIHMEQVRTTLMVEQVYPPHLAPKGCLPRVKTRNKVFRFVDNTHAHKTPDITCILTDFVQGVGVGGDTVTIKRRLFRGKLHPAGLAVYATPENIEKFATDKMGGGSAEQSLGVFAEMTLKQMSGMYLKVPMSGDNPWVLSPKHVRVALRKSGVEVKEGCITLPQEPIMGAEEFNFRITINGLKSTLVKGRVVLRHKDVTKNDLTLDLPPNFSPTSGISTTAQCGSEDVAQNS